MTSQLRKSKANWSLIFTALFVLSILLLFPVWSSFQVDSDEGFHLGQAMLLEEGYPLYTTIWSEHPPIVPYILAGMIKLFGLDVVASRLLFLAFSAILFWSYFEIATNFANLSTAIFAAIILIIAPPFLRVSFAVMSGLPAISLATFSLLAILKWHKSSKMAWLVISAFALSLSVATKLFTGLLVPIFFVGLIITDIKKDNSSNTARQKYSPTILWSSIFVGITAAIFFFVVGIENTLQMIAFTLEARSSDLFQKEVFTIPTSLFFGVLIGTILLIREKKYFFLYAIFWTFISYALLENHSPAWYHQDLLFTVPASLVSGYGVSEGFRLLAASVRGKMNLNWSNTSVYLSLGALLFFFVFLNTDIPPKFIKRMVSPILPLRFSSDFKEDQDATLEAINRFSAETEYIFTDQAMYAYRSGISLLPNPSSIFSAKRYLTGDLTEEQMIMAIAEFVPEQIVLGRYKYPDLVAFLEQDYSQITYEGGKVLHFVRNDILE